MAKFCENCGTQLKENAKFCAECGQTAVKEQEQPVQQSQEQQPQIQSQQAPAALQERPVQTEQPAQYQQPYAAPAAQTVTTVKKKKSKLKIILPIVVLALIGIACLVIFLILPFMMNTMAERDFYTIATNDVPTVKYILGEKRSVTGVSTATRSDGFQEQNITYKSEEGESPKNDMFTYATKLCTEHGFYALDDYDFTGETGSAFQLAKLSKIESNLVIVQIDYDMAGYTVSLLHGPGTLKIPTGSGKNEVAPWVGLWRSEGEGVVGLYHLKEDDTFSIDVYNEDAPEEDIHATGTYSVSDSEITFSDRIFNGEAVEGDVVLPIEVNGDTINIDGEICGRVPEKDVESVLANPLAPSTPGTTEPPVTSEPPTTTQSPGTIQTPTATNPPATTEPQTPTANFTGTWQISSSWGGEMTLSQNGDKVTGTYGKPSGKLEGTVSGNVLTAFWSQANNSSGHIRLTMSEDGKSFSVQWTYEKDISKVDWSQLIINEHSVLISSESPAVTNPPTTTPPTTTNPPATTQPTDPPSGNLSDIEEKLVGIYSFGKVPDGLYTDWKSRGIVDYEKWSSSLPLDMRIYVFNSNGTFTSVEYYYSGNQNAYAFNKLIYTKANWSITAGGTIQFTNRKETVEDHMAPANSYKDKSISDRNEYYMHDTSDGKEGIRVDSYSIDDIKEADFYEKMD